VFRDQDGDDRLGAAGGMEIMQVNGVVFHLTPICGRESNRFCLELQDDNGPVG
jgi:hypothetical protein